MDVTRSSESPVETARAPAERLRLPAALTRGRVAAFVVLLGASFVVGMVGPAALLPAAPPALRPLVGVVAFLVLVLPLGWYHFIVPLEQAFELRLAEQAAKASAAEERLRSHEHDARLRHALEIAEDEDAVLRIADQALGVMAETAGVQLMVASDPDGDIEHSLVRGDMDPAAECVIKSPRECPTVRRGQGLVYEDGMALTACKGLRGQIDAGCAAACAPIFVGGRGTGMIRALGTAGDPTLYRKLQALTFNAHQIGTRLNTIRSVAASEAKATTDPLTGLFNRRALDARLEILIEQRAPFALAVADIDHFKKINDTYGHDVGDRALKALASALKEGVRNHDLVCRFGGEEFVLLLIGFDAPGAVEVVERVRGLLPKVTVRAGVPSFTISVGVVSHSEADDAPALLRIADQLLYQAKSAGRDRVQITPRRAPSLAPAPLTASS